MVASGGARGGTDLPPIDVLIVVALEDELDAVLVEGGGADGWRKVRDHVHVRTLPNDAGHPLGVAAVWTGAMGSTATAARAAPLVKELQPSCLAMCGICAGKRGDVALGDVIVADRVYGFDHGKLVAARDGKAPPSFFHDIETYNLERSWRMDAASFRRELGWAKALLSLRPPTKQAQRRWLLRALHAHERGSGPPPLEHPERAAMFRTAIPGTSDWAKLIMELRKQQLVEPGPGTLRLTEAGRLAVDEDYLLYPDGAPVDPGFQVHVGPIATGNAVIEDPQIFERLKFVGRKTLGVEMEAYAIGHVGDDLPQRAIVAKAVSDHADHDKDDRFREFACRASAAWLFAFLNKHLTPKPVETREHGETTPGDPGPRSPFPDLAASRREDSRSGTDEQNSPGELRLAPDLDGIGELDRRVARALALRYPGLPAIWKQGPGEVSATLRTFLEIREPRSRHTTLHVVAVVEGDIEDSTLESFLEHIVKRYGLDQHHVEPRLVYTGTVPNAVRDRAGKQRVRLESLLELQGLLEFRPYIKDQVDRHERDPVYPPGLFVPQRLEYRVGLDSFKVEDALEALDSWLGQDGPQLMLVLGDFGTGKTFLMHELALRLGRRHLEMSHAIVPILVELRRLEKSRSLDALLGQHFIPERGMRRFDHDAFRYMLQEGRLALLFDGFDELALRMTYAAAAEHLETVLQAAIGNAKVMITSRTQHFLNDRQVLQALGRHVQQRGFRMMRLLPFDRGRIKRFLFNRFGDATVAQQRFELLDEVKDLLGLSHNPRMLGFIAELDEQQLRAAAQGGEITSAALYRVLLSKWLGHEVTRDHPPGIEIGASEAARWKAATELAKLLWTRKERTIAVGEIPPEILDEVGRLSERPVSRDAAAFKIGSATLLCRDEEGRFSFIHQSIVEWLVASAEADDLRAGRPSVLLASAEMSDLMADFLLGLVGQDRMLAWARAVLAAPASELAAANANRVLQRLGHDKAGKPAVAADIKVADVVADLAGHDLRGRDFSGTSHLRGAMLERANLSESSLVGANLSRARLARAKLQRANLTQANLRGADLQGADLSFARLLGADLTGAKLMGARLHYSALVGARVDPEHLRQADVRHVAPSRPGHCDVTIGAPRASCGAVAFSPDGALLAAGYADGTVVICDGTTGGVVRVLDGHSGAVMSIAFSPDGGVLASSSADKTIRLWRPDTGKLLHVLRDHAGWVMSVAFAPDGSVLASASSDKTIRLWRADTGRLLREIGDHPGWVKSIAFSSDGRILASASDDRAVRLWRPSTGELIRTVEVHTVEVHTLEVQHKQTLKLDWEYPPERNRPPDVVRGVAFSPDGDTLASVHADGAVRIWSLDRGELRLTLSGHSDQVVNVAFSADGRMLATASADKTVRLWSADTGQLLRFLEGHSGRVVSVAFSPDGRVLASGSTDNAFRLWSAETGTFLRALGGHSSLIGSVAFVSDGRTLASASDDGAIRLWSPDTGKLLHALEGHDDRVGSIASSHDGRVLASASSDKTIRVWSLESGKLAHILHGHAGTVQSVAFSPDVRVLASAGNDMMVRLWNPDTGTLLRALKGHADSVRSVAFSPDGGVLASASDDKTIRLWRPESRALLRVLEGHAHRVVSVAFSPDGGVLASASDDKTIRLWSPRTGKIRRVLDDHADGVTSVAFSPDGRILASGSSDKTIRLWNPETGKVLRVLDGHSHRISSVAFSPDRRVLASGSFDKVIRLWGIEAALRGDPQACQGVIVPGRRGWAAYTLDGRYKLGGNAPGLLGFAVGLCRFEPGELDAHPDAFDHPPRRIGEDEPLFPLGP